MTTTAAFTIYNASAGAGKTYTLVREYLIKLFKSGRADGYRTILAVTFTNKAVAEMKARIIAYLRAFSQEEVPEQFLYMCEEIQIATELNRATLKIQAAKILKSIIHNYAAFDVLTIDTFTHRVIRTFANDLDIPMNFEVEMDSDALLEEAIALLVSKVGVDSRLTSIIINFALSKLDDDKSWDISQELHQVGRLIFSENDREYLANLKLKKPEDFDTFKNVIFQQLKLKHSQLIQLATDILKLIDDKGLSNVDFTGKGWLPKHFDSFIQKKATAKSFDAGWKNDIENAAFYTKALDDTKKATIDQIRPELIDAFHKTKELFFDLELLYNLKKNVIPLSVLNAIQRALVTIKKERNILLISEFNSIVSTAIKDEPAPFIYERLGERYRDYFIDEFQDTSVLQWQNMIPLADNALASETLEGKQGSMTIVGDAKQAIYRWRGGKAEQFMDLYADKNPFSVPDKVVRNLPRNFRSYSEIIHFNNSFFSHIAKDFSTITDQQLYTNGNAQQINTKKGGYVQLTFIDAANIEEENEIYPVEVFKTIQEVVQKGYQYNDICILTRKLRQGVVLANYLTTQGVPIISSETLLLSNASEVIFLINLLKLFTQPRDKKVRVQLLHFLADKYATSNKHDFIAAFLQLPIHSFCKNLEVYDVYFSFDKLKEMTLYESAEYCIRSFHLDRTPSAYIQFFLDIIFEFGQKNSTGILGLLTFWELKKDKLSIATPTETAAVQIMTVHKSKGLEFPVVLYPYVNDDIYYERNPKTWYPLKSENFAGFKDGFLNYTTALSSYGAIGTQLVQQRKAQQELDAMNILYVAMTRAVEQLYIFSKLDVSSKGVPNPRKYSGKLINYLISRNQWDGQQLSYSFGNSDKPIAQPRISTENSTTLFTQFHSTPKETHRIYIVTNGHKIWDSKRHDAIIKGTLLHELLATIYLPKDIKPVLKDAVSNGTITLAQSSLLSKELQSVVAHPELAGYFTEESEIFNERPILHNGEYYRPDRLIIHENKATILDYKTGQMEMKHKTQVKHYATLMKSMGYQIDAIYLVYINPSVAVVSVQF